MLRLTITNEIMKARDVSAANELVIDSARSIGLWQGLREVWTFREVVWAFAERSVRLKYNQAALGIAWAVLQPLAFLGIFMLIFRRVPGLSGNGVSYPAFALSALVPWVFLQTAVSFGAQALLMDAPLIKKVYFPREAPVLGAVIGASVDFAIGLGLLLVLASVLGARLSWTVLLVLPLWIGLGVLSLSVAMILGALTVYYRDFRYVLPLLLQFWMLASPVAYPLTAVPAHWKNLYVVVNPAVGFIDGFRKVLAEGRFPDLGLLAISLAVTAGLVWAGFAVFRRLEAGFADAV